ncbi:uncharacterized protein TRIVIDRAFT_92681 [Trichoderma virens Gv29-8]|uniref:Uncharacterized protein n=1 Tax=Hypocrea virens (strain Gv29-8 / FGSC 10586) TaxID=413071 RepID=G9N2T8_HYPVG|nr:uncharacterized protein TRIVIDRAFT_92681 [Trichoderma virens Gv29-8]EHK18997.1 hypothetical protein TRIVIDRAFT_92681 [Trichoderma virens Gv29-8]
METRYWYLGVQGLGIPLRQWEERPIRLTSHGGIVPTSSHLTGSDAIQPLACRAYSIFVNRTLQGPPWKMIPTPRFM